MSRTWGTALLILLGSISLASLEGCTGSVESTQTARTCPVGQEPRYDHCVIPGPPGSPNDAADCHPVACQVYSDWSLYGTGGQAAMYCAAACQAHCAGDKDQERLNVDDAKLRGMSCTY